MAHRDSYAIVRTMFGDIWIGKTQLKPDEKDIFSSLPQALDRAKEIFQEFHYNFDPNSDIGDEDYNDDLAYAYEELQKGAGVECIRETMEHYIVRR